MRILNKGYKIIYEPDAVVTHIINKEKLTRKYLLKRSFWQGYSEIMRIRNSANFKLLWKELDNSQTSNFIIMGNMKINELFFEIDSRPTLKEKIDSFRKLGRLLAYLSLVQNKIGG